MKKLTTFGALSAAAMAIPSEAEVAPSDQILSYRYSSYQEADSPRERTFTPETGRYQIDVHQIGYRTPIGESWYLASELQYETMSGASPTQTYKDDNKSVLTMSGASIEEQRIDIKLAPKKYLVHGSLGGLVALSKENDYQSFTLGTDGSLEIFNKHTTLIGSLSVSYDELSPTDVDLSTSRAAADGEIKRSFSIYEGISQVIDKHSTLQVGVGYTQLSGYLSDPYKFEDRRPDERDQFSLTAQYSHYRNLFDGAALHSSLRYYYDDWGISSHVLEVKWAQQFNLANYRFIITPLARYYTQTEADFYSLEKHPADDQLNSSDYRLSSYGAITLGLTSEVKVSDWVIHLDWSQYTSRELLTLFAASDDETPALVNFTTFTVGVDYQF